MAKPLTLLFAVYVRLLTGAVLTEIAHANALARRGHEVHLVLAGVRGAPPISSLDDVPWIVPERDVAVHFASLGFRAASVGADVSFGIDVPGVLPARFLQGMKRRPSFDHPWPIVCVSRWLYDEARAHGVPERRLVYAPNGIDHQVFRPVVPLEERPRRVAAVYKRDRSFEDSLAVLEEVRRRLPEMGAAIFATKFPGQVLPEWCERYELPDRETLALEVYNRSRVFLCTSPSEGFGLPSLEAMASGCALATVDNGGSREFACDGDTACVTAPHDLAGLARAVERLLVDDPFRRDLVTRGLARAQAFDWDRSAGVLESFLLDYRERPEDHLDCSADVARSSSWS